MPKKSPAPFICLGIVAVVVIAAVCFFAFRGCAGSQVELLAPGQSAEVTITEGETASSIGDALVAARLIGSSWEFTDEVTRLEAASALIPGTYAFQGGSTPEELVRAIMAGPAQVGDTLAVPEDITRAELSELVASATAAASPPRPSSPLPRTRAPMRPTTRFWKAPARTRWRASCSPRPTP